MSGLVPAGKVILVFLILSEIKKVAHVSVIVNFIVSVSLLNVMIAFTTVEFDPGDNTPSYFIAFKLSFVKVGFAACKAVLISPVATALEALVSVPFTVIILVVILSVMTVNLFFAGLFDLFDLFAHAFVCACYYSSACACC